MLTKPFPYNTILVILITRLFNKEWMNSKSIWVTFQLRKVDNKHSYTFLEGIVHDKYFSTLGSGAMEAANIKIENVQLVWMLSCFGKKQ